MFNVKAPDEEERTRNVHFQYYPRFELITIFIFSALIGKFTMFYFPLSNQVCSFKETFETFYVAERLSENNSFAALLILRE